MLILVSAVTLAIGVPALQAQNAAGTAQMHAAIVRAIRADAPPAPYLLVYDAKRSNVAQVAARLAGVRAVVGRLVEGTPVAAGGDTISLRITVDSLGASTAVATVDVWGSLRPRSRYAPTAWFVTRRVDLVLRNKEWIVSRLTTLMES